MASIVQVQLSSLSQNIFNKCISFKFAARYYPGSTIKLTKRQKKNVIAAVDGFRKNRIKSVADSLASKGFLRVQPSYVPMNNIKEKVEEICIQLNIPKSVEYKFLKVEEKYNFLNACSNLFLHNIPNSRIHEINDIGNVIDFYMTAVDTRTPLEAMKSFNLPENLQIQNDYVRFNSESDILFNGQTAFPKSSTLITGLKYRGSYRGNVAKRFWF